MKAKVKNKNSGYYDVIIEVKMIDYNYVYGMLPGGYSKVKLQFNDVEFIFDEGWEKDIVKHRDLLNIPIPRTSSLKLYAAIGNALEGTFGEEFKSVVIMRDYCEKVRKKIWYKTTELVINGNCPVMLKITGHDYHDLYDIKLEEIEKARFISECKGNVDKLKDLLDKNKKKIELYEEVMKHLQDDRNIEDYTKMIQGV